MATPSRAQLAKINLASVRKGEQKKRERRYCQRQFPDCPEEMNEDKCKMCPFYIK